MSKTYSLKAVQQIPASLDEVWDFFSAPDNLNFITPPHIHFKVISKHHGPRLYAGQVIEYYLSPLLGTPLYWMTEISHVEPGKYFIDQQRFGPYRLWHHQHHFKEIDGGVEMTDIVHYKLPLWFVGDIVNSLWARNELRKIFQFRYKAVEEKFGNWKESKEVIEFD